MTKGNLYLKLAKPNDKGVSREVSIDEVTGEYQKLKSTNGYDWIRRRSALQKKYNITIKRNNGRVNGKVLSIKLDGYKNK